MLIYLQMIETPEDKSKFEQIYDKYLGLMYHVALKMLENHDDAEDAVHQAFVSIAENIKTIHPAECPETKSYIVITIESKSIDIIRHRKRVTNVLEFDETMWGIDIPDEDSFDMAALIGRLPARYREVLLLRFDNGYTTKEISKILGLSPANAEKLIYRAKVALQKMIAEDGIMK